MNHQRLIFALGEAAGECVSNKAIRSEGRENGTVTSPGPLFIKQLIAGELIDHSEYVPWSISFNIIREADLE